MIVMFTLTQDMLASLRERATTDTRLLRAAFEGDACAFTFIHASKLRDHARGAVQQGHAAWTKG